MAKAMAWGKEIRKISCPRWKALCQVIVMCAVFTIQDKVEAPKTWFVSPRLCWPEGGHSCKGMEVHEIPCFILLFQAPVLHGHLQDSANASIQINTLVYVCQREEDRGDYESLFTIGILGRPSVGKNHCAQWFTELMPPLLPRSSEPNCILLYPQPSTQQDVRNYKTRRRIWRGA